MVALNESSQGVILRVQHVERAIAVEDNGVAVQPGAEFDHSGGGKG